MPSMSRVSLLPREPHVCLVPRQASSSHESSSTSCGTSKAPSHRVCLVPRSGVRSPVLLGSEECAHCDASACGNVSGVPFVSALCKNPSTTSLSTPLSSCVNTPPLRGLPLPSTNMAPLSLPSSSADSGLADIVILSSSSASESEEDSLSPSYIATVDKNRSFCPTLSQSVQSSTHLPHRRSRWDNVDLPVCYPVNNPRCKCRPLDVETVCFRPGFESLRAAPQDLMLQYNRCKYFLRRHGCKHGEQCEYCHVHPVPKHLTGGNVDVNLGIRLSVDERRAWKRRRTSQDIQYSCDWADLTTVSRDDARGYINFGSPTSGVQCVVWTIARLQASAFVTQRHVAKLLLGDASRCNEVGIWLGRDKLCHGVGHYPCRESHGVYTLMGGFATRLSRLEHQLADSVRGIIFMESDAQLVRRCHDGLPSLFDLIYEEDFVHLGYFIRGRRNHYVSRKGSVLYRGTGDLPAYGCQMFWISRRRISELVARLHSQDYPSGLDMFFFSRYWFPRYAYLSHSLAGQRSKDSDSFDYNDRVGPIENPSVPISCMRVLSMDDTPRARRYRDKTWRNYCIKERRRRIKYGELEPRSWLDVGVLPLPAGRSRSRTPPWRRSHESSESGDDQCCTGRLDFASTTSG